MSDDVPDKTPPKSGPPPDRSALLSSARVAGLVVLSFVLGSMVVQFKMFPYPQFLEKAFLALEATVLQLKGRAWVATELAFHDDPVTKHIAEKAYDGYTFYTSAHGSHAYLVDMKGKVLHEWQAPFSEVWPDPPHVAEEIADEDVFWRRAHLFENGDVVALYETPTLTPWGMGVVKVDKDSNVLWSFAERAHNDLSVDSSGSIYTLVHSFRDTQDAPVPANPQLPSTVLDDEVVKLSADGAVSKRLSLLETITEGEFRHVLNVFPHGAEFVTASWDPLHTNSVKALEPEFARHHDWANPGDVIVSMRSFDAVAAIDMSSPEPHVTWASRGFWMGQHDVDPLPDGKLMLFDNLGHSGADGKRSRVLEFDPATNAIDWVFPPDDEKRFFSHTRSSQQVLPNGNVLITASDPGYAFEVTRSGEAVWIFLNPAHAVSGPETGRAGILGATRVSRDYLEFDPSGR